MNPNKTCDLLLDLTKTYPSYWDEDTLRGEGLVRLDLTGLSGTDLYCDDFAREEILQNLAQYEISGIHLLDSGNSHYLTRLFTSRVDEPYILIFFDHHTDMKPAAFEGLLSCGNWALEVLEQDKNLRKLLLVGPPEHSLAEIPEEARSDERLFILTEECLSEECLSDEAQAGGRLREAAEFLTTGGDPLPVYLSVDKDILSEEEVLTNWDQGDLSLRRLCDLVGFFCKGKRILGADICGNLPNPAGTEEAKAQHLGLSSDLALLSCIRSL